MTKYRTLKPDETPQNGDQSKRRRYKTAQWITLTPRKTHVQNPDFEYRRPLPEVPEPGVTLGGCRVHRVIDGDTVEVEVTRRIRVRLLDCWAPESHRTNHACEKELGLKAKAALQEMAPVGSECKLHVPTDGDQDAGDGLTFGRVVGNVWISREMPIAEQMRLAGYTYRTKAELEAFLTAEDDKRAQANFDKI